jgi:hypothetical protein
MADLTPEQRQVLDHTLQAVQRIALAMLDYHRTNVSSSTASRGEISSALSQVGIKEKTAHNCSM